MKNILIRTVKVLRDQEISKFDEKSNQSDFAFQFLNKYAEEFQNLIATKTTGDGNCF